MAELSVGSSILAEVAPNPRDQGPHRGQLMGIWPVEFRRQRHGALEVVDSCFVLAGDTHAFAQCHEDRPGHRGRYGRPCRGVDLRYPVQVCESVLVVTAGIAVPGE